MIQARVGAHVVQRAARPGPKVRRAEHQPADTSGDECPRAHRARLEGHDERRVGEPPRAGGGCSVAQGQHLGMGGGVARPLPFVVPPGEHPAVIADDNGTDRDVTVRHCRLGLGQRQVHGLGVGHRSNVPPDDPKGGPPGRNLLTDSELLHHMDRSGGAGAVRPGPCRIGGRTGESHLTRRQLQRALALVAAVFLVSSCGRGATHRSDATPPGSSRGLDLEHLSIEGSPTVELAVQPTGLSGDVAIAAPPEAFDGPAAPASPPPRQLTNPFAGVRPSGGTWAVMIGINDYPGTSHDLNSAVNDAMDVNEALGRLGVPGDHRLLITDRQATPGVVRLAADWLVAHAAPDAVAVFAYAGHVRKLSADTEAIVAADGGVVTDADLAGHLAKLQAQRTWIAIAACYGGGFTELLGPGRVLTAAADANSLAWENESFGRSYMVQYMVRHGLIEGQSASTVQGSFAYASAALAHDYPGREPVELNGTASTIELRPTAVVSSSAAPPPAPSGGHSTGGGSGSGSGSGGGSTTPTTEGCKSLTLGVLTCH